MREYKSLEFKFDRKEYFEIRKKLEGKLRRFIITKSGRLKNLNDITPEAYFVSYSIYKKICLFGRLDFNEFLNMKITSILDDGSILAFPLVDRNSIIEAWNIDNG